MLVSAAARFQLTFPFPHTNTHARTHARTHTRTHARTACPSQLLPANADELLPSLTELDLGENELAEVPAAVYRIRSLRRLKIDGEPWQYCW